MQPLPQKNPAATGHSIFPSRLDPAKVMAMFNIEMIGTDSKWGKNSAYITGYEKSDFGKMLQDNLKGSAFVFLSRSISHAEFFLPVR